MTTPLLGTSCRP